MKSTLIFIFLLYIFCTNLNMILCETERCKDGQINMLKIFKRIKGTQAKTIEICKNICNDDEECEHFRYKVRDTPMTKEVVRSLGFKQDDKRVRRKVCLLMRVAYKPRRGWSSGPRHCTSKYVPAGRNDS